MANIEVFVGTYSHRYDVDVYTDASLEAAKKTQARIAREYWDDRADQSAPDDHSNLTDDNVIAAYFDGNDSETYDINISTLDLPNVTDANEIEALRATSEKCDELVNLALRFAGHDQDFVDAIQELFGWTQDEGDYDPHGNVWGDGEEHEDDRLTEAREALGQYLEPGTRAEFGQWIEDEENNEFFIGVKMGKPGFTHMFVVEFLPETHRVIHIQMRKL